MKFLLDTNVFREIGKMEPNPNVNAWLDTVDDADLAISALTVREVHKGIVKLRAKKRDARGCCALGRASRTERQTCR
jgi:predicted nucleic acid-binding protein